MLFDLLIVGLLVFLAFSILLRNLLFSAIFLALASVVASIIFFSMGAVWVGVFELIVLAGLVPVIFISAISLTKDFKEEIDGKKPLLFFPVYLIVILCCVIFGVHFFSQNLSEKKMILQTGEDTFKQIFWGTRKFDILGQMSVILGGVFGIAAFFEKIKKSKTINIEDDRQKSKD